MYYGNLALNIIFTCSLYNASALFKAVARKICFWGGGGGGGGGGGKLAYFCSFARSLLSASYCHGYNNFGSGPGVGGGGGGGGGNYGPAIHYHRMTFDQ